MNVLRGDHARASAWRCRPGITRYAYPDVRRIPSSRVQPIVVTWQNRVKRMRAKTRLCHIIHHRSLWLCVHAHEGAWDDPNPPYWGGLQMGQWFHETYGGELYRTKGYADNWTPAEQMRVADRAYHGTGHSSAWLNGQWPGTRSECGA